MASWHERRTHLLDRERTDRFPRAIIAVCGHVGPATSNLDLVTCRRCLTSHNAHPSSAR